MNIQKISEFQKSGRSYLDNLYNAFELLDWKCVESLFEDLIKCWKSGNTVFFCGNGGSAGNAIHIVNDYIYGIAKRSGGGLSAIALSSNPAVLTCLANDISFDDVFSEQLSVHGKKNDILVVLSGSGNSPNILKAIREAKKIGLKSHCIVGFDGGKAKIEADNSIHLPIHDMQIAEDSQLIISHIIMQNMYKARIVQND